MLSSTVTFSFPAPATLARAGRPVQLEAQATSSQDVAHVPRVARLMALAIHFDGLVRSGAVSDYGELARLGRVSRPRITQIMGLLLLAPDMEELLALPLISEGHAWALSGRCGPSSPSRTGSGSES